MKQNVEIQYSIFDPTGNITALVESDVETGLQPSVAARLMERRPEVEQVGFVRLAPGGEGPSLRMAGGEFCGNATMSAAALYLIRRWEGHEAPLPGEEETVHLCVSGAARPVEVRLWAEAPDCFRAGVHMPQALGIDDREFAYGALSGKLPIVWMEGISHIVIEPDSVFWGLLADRIVAEQAVRDWCTALSVGGLGLMFLDGDAPRRCLTPLVDIPGSGPVFWESSCASGSTAAGMCLAAKIGASVDLTLQEPGGVLRVVSDSTRAHGETWLYGRVKLAEHGQLSM